MSGLPGALRGPADAALFAQRLQKVPAGHSGQQDQKE